MGKSLLYEAHITCAFFSSLAYIFRAAVDHDSSLLFLQVGLLKLGVTLVEACPEAAVPLSKGLVEALLSDFLFATPTPAR